MAFFSNAAVNRLVVHSSLRQLAWSLSSVFLGVFLLRAGVAPPRVLAVLAGLLALRFVMRPLVLPLVRAFGLRRTLIIGALACCAEPVALAGVSGLDRALVAYVLLTGLGDVLYWTTYHTVYACLGDAENRGAQVAARGFFWMLASAAGPLVGGTMLTIAGPQAAFGLAAAVGLVAVVPLWPLDEVPLPLAADTSFRAVRSGVALFMTDGFVMTGGACVWDMIAFSGLGSRFDAFGGLLSAAAVAGALGGMAFGKLIDAGHGRRAVWINLAIFCGLILLRSACAGSGAGIVLATLTANALGGFYVPTLMTAVYNAAKASPCAFRFHFAAEGAWDVGGIFSCLVAGLMWQEGIAPRLIILIGIAGAAVQGFVLRRRYGALPAAVATPAPA